MAQNNLSIVNIVSRHNKRTGVGLFFFFFIDNKCNVPCPKQSLPLKKKKKQKQKKKKKKKTLTLTQPTTNNKTYFFLLQQLKLLVEQSCPTLCDPMDGGPPGSSVHGILQARAIVWEAFPSPGYLLNPGMNLSLLHCRQILYYLRHHGNPIQPYIFFQCLCYVTNSSLDNGLIFQDKMYIHNKFP